MAMPKIVFTSPVLEHPPAGGPPLRIENSIKFLARLSELHVVSRVATHAVGRAEGIPVTHGHDCLIADTPEDFAHAIITLLGDLQLGKRLGMNCRELVQKQYSIAALTQEAETILAYLNAGPKSS